MAPSKSTRIMILLAIDTCFFFLELVVGYAVHSLALVADSFHMVCNTMKIISKQTLTVISAQRCDLTSRWTVGSQGRKPADKLEAIHLWLAARRDSRSAYQRCLSGCAVPLHLPRGYSAFCRTTGSFAPQDHSDCWLIRPGFQHCRPVPLPRSWTRPLPWRTLP